MPKPLDSARLDDLALGYVARFATTAAKLEAYLRRKLRDYGWAGEDEPPVTAVVNRLVSAGYLDDRSYALAKAGGLLRRGYGRRRIDQMLGAAGVAEGLREEAHAGRGAERQAVLVFAKRRSFGPFGSKVPDAAVRQKQIAAILRAGHPLDSARRIVDAQTVAALEDWALADGED